MIDTLGLLDRDRLIRHLGHRASFPDAKQDRHVLRENSRYLAAIMRDSYLEDYFTFLRFPSISTDDAYSERVAECAHWLVQKLNGIGLTTQLVPTAGHPIVWSHNKHQPGRKTVLLYGHYDVQPPD